MSVTEVGSIAIVVDQKCNIKCDHCCFSSGPKSAEHLSDDEILEIVQNAATDPDIHTVGFSGGEALLRRDLIIKCLMILSAAGMTSSVTTNGYWGQTAKKAEKEARELKKAGLSVLTVSYDSFHAAYMPAIRIRNILDACRAIHLRCRLNVAITKKLGAAPIIESLGDSIVGVPVSIFPTEPVGRAEKIGAEELIRKETDPAALRCPGFEPTFHFDHKIYPCCSPAVFSTCLSIGKVGDESVSKAVRYIEHNAYFAIIRKEGFGWLYNTAVQMNLIPEQKEGFVDVCELCHILTSNEQIFKALAPKIIGHYRELCNTEKAA